MPAKIIKQSLALTIITRLVNNNGSTSNSTHVARLYRFTGTHVCNSCPL